MSSVTFFSPLVTASPLFSALSTADIPGPAGLAAAPAPTRGAVSVPGGGGGGGAGAFDAGDRGGAAAEPAAAEPSAATSTPLGFHAGPVA
jgi:hypothetical protein